MDYYGIKSRGPFWIQIVSTLPTWLSEYEGRLVYATSDNKLYVGTSSGWEAVGYGGLSEVEIRPSLVDLDDINTGADNGQVFGIIDSIDFSSLEDGTIFSTFKFPDGWSLDEQINIDIFYHLEGNDPAKNVRLKTEIL